MDNDSGMMRRLVFALALAWVCGAAAGDVIELNDGRSIRDAIVLSETDATVQVKRGTMILTIQRELIKKVIREARKPSPTPEPEPSLTPEPALAREPAPPKTPQAATSPKTAPETLGAPGAPRWAAQTPSFAETPSAGASSGLSPAALSRVPFSPAAALPEPPPPPPPVSTDFATPSPSAPVSRPLFAEETGGPVSVAALPSAKSAAPHAAAPPRSGFERRPLHFEWAPVPATELSSAFISALSASGDLLWAGTWREGLLVHKTGADQGAGQWYRATFEENANLAIALQAGPGGCWICLGDGRIARVDFMEETGDVFEFGPPGRRPWFESAACSGQTWWFASQEEIVSCPCDRSQWDRWRSQKIEALSPMTYEQWREDAVLECLRDDQGRSLRGKSQDPQTESLRRWAREALAEGRAANDVIGERLRTRGAKAVALGKRMRLVATERGMLLIHDGRVWSVTAGAPGNEAKPFFSFEDLPDLKTVFTDAAATGSLVAAATADDGFMLRDAARDATQRIARARPVTLWQTTSREGRMTSDEDNLAAVAVDGAALWLASATGRLIRCVPGRDALGTPVSTALDVFIHLYPNLKGQITSLAVHDAAVWVGTTNGMARLDLSGAAKPRPPIEKGQWVRYSPDEKTAAPTTSDPIELRYLYAGVCESLGAPYAKGGDSLKGFDASGFTQSVFRPLGVALPHSVAGQHDFKDGTHAVADLRLGDLLFFNDKGAASYHCGVYLGGGLFAHCLSAAGAVTVSSLADAAFPLTGVRRLALKAPDKSKEKDGGAWLAALETNLAEALADLAPPVLKARAKARAQGGGQTSAQAGSGPAAPFAATVTDKGNEANEISLTMNQGSAALCNGAVILALLSGNLPNDSLAKKIKGAVARVTLLTSPADLRAVGCDDPSFGPLESGAVFLMRVPASKAGVDQKTTLRFEYRPAEADALYVAALRGPAAGTLHKIR